MLSAGKGGQLKAQKREKWRKFPLPRKGAFQKFMQYEQQKQEGLWKGNPCNSRDKR